ncbi:MAG TPA: ATP-binding protein [Flavitalea sp.]|nr:ATP-binding protein [Flavitalea sp.]
MNMKKDLFVNDQRVESEQDHKYFLAAIVESSQDSIVSIDINRVITTWNKSAEHLYGYPSQEVIGKSLEVVMLPKDIVALIDNVHKIMHSVSVPMYETVRMHKSGKLIDLQIALSPVRNLAGKVIGISTFARDITEAKLQEQLKDEFIAVASHELKTPVTSIKSYVEILVDKFKESPDCADLPMLTKLDNQVNRLIELIKTLLDTTKLTAGEVLLKVELFDLHSLIIEQVENVQRTAPNHHIIIEDEKDFSVVADRKLIGQVITNLLTNAIKYSPNGGKIIVLSRKTNKGAAVSVQDFGVGIPEGLDHKIFDRYFRVNNVHKIKVPGIGLGLYITAQIVHQHGGKIYVDSKEGEGSTFCFTLPQMNVVKPVAV